MGNQNSDTCSANASSTAVKVDDSNILNVHVPGTCMLPIMPPSPALADLPVSLPPSTLSTHVTPPAPAVLPIVSTMPLSSPVVVVPSVVESKQQEHGKEMKNPTSSQDLGDAKVMIHVPPKAFDESSTAKKRRTKRKGAKKKEMMKRLLEQKYVHRFEFAS